MVERKVISGAQAIAEAVRLVRPGVIAAYPITPQTGIVEALARFVADGMLDSEFITVESEHSAMAACIGAQATGVRSYTATSSQGLALMSELLWVASGMRLPIVMTVANRALSAPLNIWNDQSDSLAFRDAGWIQIYAENAQEAYDSQIQAWQIAEKVNLPVMVCIDGYVLSHTYEPVQMIDSLKPFLKEYRPEVCLNPAKPVTLGCLATPEWYVHFKKQQNEAMKQAETVIKDTNRAFHSNFGRCYGNGLIEVENDGNDCALITAGSVTGTVRACLDEIGIGLIKLRCFRPFPVEEMRKACKGLRAVGVLEKAVSFGAGGPIYNEVSSALHGFDINISGFATGLGGQDITLEMIKEIAERIKQGRQGFDIIA
ncbi:MAG: pyruvate ferredoxin oxidoreductase [Candidatus Aenigmatarchaeota archaeon]